jgi:putative transcriptional regulator
VPVVVTLDVMLARRKVKSYELARAVGITESNLSLLKSGRVKGIRFSTLAAICRYLECEPGDILAYAISDDDLAGGEQDEEGDLPRR